MKYINLTIVLSFLLIACAPLTAAEKWRERDYQEAWCGAQPDLIAIEYRLPDKTRVDCLLADYALEVDWDSWEAQAVFGFLAEKGGIEPAPSMSSASRTVPHSAKPRASRAGRGASPQTSHCHARPRLESPLPNRCGPK